MDAWKKKTRKIPPVYAGAGKSAQKDAGAKPAPKAVELYKDWAESSKWRGYLGGGRVGDEKPGKPAAQQPDPEGPSKLRIIGWLRDPSRRESLLKDQRLKIPDVYHPAQGQQPLEHFTAELSRAALKEVSSDYPELRWELAVTVRSAPRWIEAAQMGEHGPTREASAFLAKAPRRAAKAQAQTAKDDGKAPTLAIIDFGCAFLNHVFEHPETGLPRVAAIWDQDDKALQARGAFRRWWKDPAGMGYGRVLDAAAIAELHRLVHADPDAEWDESETYRGIHYLLDFDDPRRRAWRTTHGTSALHALGGWPDPAHLLTGQAHDDAEPDPAAKARLLFVQLPSMSAADSSGGSLSGHLLDGLHWLLQQRQPGTPLVVSISYGTFAGPHDGSSLIESAMDELIKKRGPDFAIVLSAGNAREAGCHQRRTVYWDKSALLALTLPGGDPTDSFVEIWYDVPHHDQLRLRLRARTSDREWSDWVCAGEMVSYDDAQSGEPKALLQHELKVMHGERAMALLSFAPTSGGSFEPRPLAPDGLWEIELALEKPPPRGVGPEDWCISFDAWVERDDPGPDGLGAQSHFADQRAGDEADTLSSLAGGKETIVVGACRWPSRWPADYSSQPGPRWRTEVDSIPLVYAPAAPDDDERGLQTTAVRSGEIAQLSGTSVAAPVVARRLFNARVNKQVSVAGRQAWKQLLLSLVDEPDSLVLRAAANPPASGS